MIGHGNRFVNMHLLKECSGKQTRTLKSNYRWLTEETKQKAYDNTQALLAKKLADPLVQAQKQLHAELKSQMIADIQSLREAYELAMENLLANPKFK